MLIKLSWIVAVATGDTNQKTNLNNLNQEMLVANWLESINEKKIQN